MEKIVVMGGGGFVGSHVVSRLSAEGYQVKVLTRHRESVRHLLPLPNVQVEECDVFFETALNRAVRGCDAVINLIGILHESGRRTFDRIHVELPRRVAQACLTQGVPRLLHMSALRAAPDAPSAYLRSRAAGEAAVRETLAGSEVGLTVFQPSVIFGRGDSFLNLFAKLARWLPVILLAKPDARFQPIFVEDVAQAVVASLQMQETVGQTYPLCGPRVYTLKQLVQLVAQTVGLRRMVIGLDDRCSYLQAWAMELLPVKLMTRDNLRSMQVDSVSDAPFPAVFGFAPTPLESVAPGYLADDHARAAFLRFRARAGR